ncbi:hypothetical protein [Adhaeribacter soli]|uniref:hypothetical protein n=1 Tax=Adhaeribacter soli TaxID=2607655 RepID=UPI00178012F0|nr:hypothetical protein [Adhaeribacter soli]
MHGDLIPIQWPNSPALPFQNKGSEVSSDARWLFFLFLLAGVLLICWCLYQKAKSAKGQNRQKINLIY